MEKLDAKKLKEWREWGKDAYKNAARMMRNNASHPDYDTKEKREALHDAYNGSYMLEDARTQVLKSKWGYSDEAVKQAHDEFKAGYDGSRAWYKREDAKHEQVLKKYESVFRMAESIAAKVDVSDIVDGFPCGSAHLYLAGSMRDTDLGKALAHFEGSTSNEYKYRLPIKMPTYGQCIAFDERICRELKPFLDSNGIATLTHTWID